MNVIFNMSDQDSMLLVHYDVRVLLMGSRRSQGGFHTARLERGADIPSCFWEK